MRQYLENGMRYVQSLLYAFTIGTKIDDLGWPWTAMSSNFLGISCDFADLREGGNNG